MLISLRSSLPISDLQEHKVHLASWNDKQNQPLDVFVRDRKEWEHWNTWRSKKDDFNRTYIFSLIDFYPDPGMWLFGGIYRVLSRSEINDSHSYKVELVEDNSTNLIGRLKVALKRPGRVRSVRLENQYSNMVVSELLKEPYSGEQFCGYERINHDFSQLETIIRSNRPDWKAALENVKGIYLIADKANGKKYVGSAYGDSGIWARWSCYIGTGHGWNDEPTKLIESEGIEYARKNFRISFLEYRSAKTEDRIMFERERYWKEAYYPVASSATTKITIQEA